MEWAALFSFIQSWGPSALSGVLVYVVVFLIRKIDNNSKKEDERALKLREDINKTLNNFGERLSVVEKDYVKNDFFYQQLSGWRTEINRVSDQINNLSLNILQSISQFFNTRNK